MIVTINPRPIELAALRVGLFALRSLPAATEEALTVVAQRARKAERLNIPRTLDRPRPFTVQSVAMRKARRDPATGQLQSMVYVLPRMAETLARLETGGTEQGGLFIRDPAFENKYGDLGKRGYERLKKRTKGTLFEIDYKGKGHKILAGLFRRKTKRRKGGGEFDDLELVIGLLRPTVDTRREPQLKFVETAREAGQTLRGEMIRQLNKRIKGKGVARL